MSNVQLAFGTVLHQMQTEEQDTCPLMFQTVP